MFVWTHAPKQPTERDRAAREQMLHRELEGRAALLLRLGHPIPYVKARLAANVAWDAGHDGKVIVSSEIDKLVDGLARRLRPR
ncbi:MAG: hypothetical protein ABI321_05175 [Polyangia bacterium]